jgi:hypothetical protein
MARMGKRLSVQNHFLKPLKFHFHWQSLLRILCHNNALLLALDTLGDMTLPKAVMARRAAQLLQGIV